MTNDLRTADLGTQRHPQVTATKPKAKGVAQE